MRPPIYTLLIAVWLLWPVQASARASGQKKGPTVAELREAIDILSRQLAASDAAYARAADASERSERAALHQTALDEIAKYRLAIEFMELDSAQVPDVRRVRSLARRFLNAGLDASHLLRTGASMKDAFCLNYLGVACYSEGDYEMACAYFAAAIVSDLDYVPTWYNICVCPHVGEAGKILDELDPKAYAVLYTETARKLPYMLETISPWELVGAPEYFERHTPTSQSLRSFLLGAGLAAGK